MRALSCLCFLLGTLLWLPPAPAANPASEEFTVPLQGTPAATRAKPRGSERARTIKDDMTGEPALRARTARGAIAAAIGQRTAGCRMIRFKRGFGWVATGKARYQATENPVATRRTQQEARFNAFLDARARLAGCLQDLAPEAQQHIAEHLKTDDAIRLALINLAANEQERRQQALKILARGFVSYSSEEDAANHTYVNLVVTPKTALRLTRPAAAAIETVALKEGLRQLLAEIEARLIPPAGNRLIVVNATGELALVGYAINLIGSHPEPAAQEKLRADAAKIATARATEALMGLVTGNDATWITSLDEASQAEIRDTASGYDDSEPSVRRFAQIRELAMSGIKDTAGLQALREGRLPTEATVKQFVGEDSVAVAVVYTPSVKKPESVPTAQSPAPEPAGGNQSAPADTR